MNGYLEYNPNVFRNKTILLPCDDPEWSNFTKFFAQNFERFGLKKLISTSYAQESKKYKSGYQPTLFEVNDPQFDYKKTVKNGRDGHGRFLHGTSPGPGRPRKGRRRPCAVLLFEYLRGVVNARMAARQAESARRCWSAWVLTRPPMRWCEPPAGWPPNWIAAGTPCMSKPRPCNDCRRPIAGRF